ncbi:MAG: glycosyltransferase family 2 protein [Oscillospiraceae bacterium]|nr:glycosyltransferase family 2 protein [Oscillospiraceae bacterium]
MESPLITVIVPVYNTEKYLSRCVESIMEQTYKEIEVILVNDGSTDNSLSVCNKLCEKYPQLIIVDKVNGGLGSARNAGIKMAKGDFIAFLDSDDWVAADCYEYMMRLAISYQADISDVMVYQVGSETENPPKVKENVETYSGREILEHYMYRGMNEQNGAPYSACRKLYKRTLFVDDTAEFVEGTVNEDICFNFRILRKCRKIVVSNQVKYYYFQGEYSITNGAMKEKDLALLKVSNDLVALAEETGDSSIIELARMKEARSYFSLLARAVKDGIDEKSIENPEMLISDLKKKLKQNVFLLLKSPMSMTRKILVVAFVINYDLCRSVIRILKK